VSIGPDAFGPKHIWPLYVYSMLAQIFCIWPKAYLALVCILHVGPNILHLAQSIVGPCMYIACWPKYSAFGPKHSWLTHCNLIAPCRFKRCFISLGPMLNIAYGCGMRFAAVDAAFSKHTVYRDGQLHLLTTRDGDNKTIVLAWAICETESKATYEYFATKCHEAGVTRYLSAAAIIFSDRQKGIKRFHAKFPSKIGRCFKHIIENCQKKIYGKGQSFTQSSAWALQRAPTEAEYKLALAKLTCECPLAAQYFDDIEPHVEVYQYAMNAAGIASHNFKTSQIVEGLNGVFVTAREHAPYRLNAKILKWMGEQIDERLQNITKWIDQGHLITKYANQLFAVQVSTTWPNWPKWPKWPNCNPNPDTYLLAHAHRSKWLNVQAKRSCQAAMESTTFRMFEEPMPRRMKSC